MAPHCVAVVIIGVAVFGAGRVEAQGGCFTQPDKFDGSQGADPCSPARRSNGHPTIRQVDGTYWELVDALAFVDAEGRLWKAPKGYKTDGATIPRSLWSVVGSPFTGPYVGAAIIHDVYCDLKTRDWNLVHKTFYTAMLASDVPKLQAKIMYYAVARFGPRWVINATAPCPFGFLCNASDPVTLTLSVKPNVDVEEAKRAVKKIESDKMDVGDIDKMADDGLFAATSQVHITGEERNSKGEVRKIDERQRGSPHLRGVLRRD